MEALRESSKSSSQRHSTRVYLAGPTWHVASGAMDKSWGCGWRNMQMLLGALLHQQPHLFEAVFPGKHRVPCIRHLQVTRAASLMSFEMNRIYIITPSHEHV